MRSSWVPAVAALVVACSPPMRIDGRSHESFVATHAGLVQSLSAADQARLMAAEMMICAAATPKGGDSTANPSLVPLEAVRGELDGKTFSEILALARTRKATVRVGFITGHASDPAADLEESKRICEAQGREFTLLEPPPHWRFSCELPGDKPAADTRK